MNKTLVKLTGEGNTVYPGYYTFLICAHKTPFVGILRKAAKDPENLKQCIGCHFHVSEDCSFEIQNIDRKYTLDSSNYLMI